MLYQSNYSRLILLSLLCFGSLGAQANPIFYEVENLLDNRWEYVYTVDNQTLDPIEEFTIFFELGLYENLALTGNPTVDWDGFVAEPDPLLPDDGFADWLTFGLAIEPGELLSGFAVAFDWLGAGTPAAQLFEVVDPITFAATSDGFTQPLVIDPPTGVPEPASLGLLGLGLLVLLRRCRLS